MHSCALAQKLSTSPSQLQSSYYNGDKEIYLSDLKEIVRDNPEALRYVRQAQTNSAVSFILGMGGLGIFGYSLINILGGVPPNLYTLIGGSTFIILSLSFGVRSGAKGGKAVDAYNNSIDTVSKIKTKSSVNLNFGGNGLSVSYHF